MVSADEGVKNDAETFAAFFGDVCVPGTGALEGNVTGVWEGLCGACGAGNCGE